MILKFLSDNNTLGFVESEFITFKEISFKGLEFKENVDALKELEANEKIKEEDKKVAKNEIYTNMLETFLGMIPCFKDRIYLSLNNGNIPTEVAQKIISPFIGVEKVIVAILSNTRPDAMDASTQAIVFSTEYSSAYLLNKAGNTIQKIV